MNVCTCAWAITRVAVLAAIRECNRLGRAVFLAKHGYRRSNRYVLVHRGREYDSKAVLGVAWGYAHGCKPLGPRDFSGGAEHCARVLLRLGFTLHRDGERLTELLVRGVLRLLRYVRKTVAAMTSEARPVVVGLVSCSKAKLDHPAPACELYSPSYVFRLSREYVERLCDAWWILSAEHGLVHPTTVIAPYDKTLSKMPKRERVAWAVQVCENLRKRYEGVRVRFVLLAGQLYALAVEGLDAEVDQPLAGLGTGHRRRWLAQHTQVA